MEQKEKEILGKMLKHISVLDEIADKTRDEFMQSAILQHAAAMAILQLGELAKFLSKEFVARTDFPVHQMRGMRNIAAHEYNALRFNDVWNTMRNNIPTLKKTILELLH